MAALKDLLPTPKDGLIPPSNPPPSTTTPKVTTAAPKTEAGVSKILALPSTNGVPDYSAIVRQGENAHRTVHTSVTSLVEKPVSDLDPLPETAETADTTARTRAALQRVIQDKLTAAQPAQPSNPVSKPSFVRYTPANTNTESQPRILKMVQVQHDPMLPPSFSHKKAPVNPPSPPVPVMHSPERKVGKAEAEKWNIPAVVSNWKNNRGYTISLEKRLAVDGRQFLDHSINDRFAGLAEALYKAERDARADVEKRGQLQRRVNMRAREEKERELRRLAERARRERREKWGMETETESVAPSESLRGFAGEDAEERARKVTEEWLEQGGENVSDARPVEDEAPPKVEGRRVRRKSRFSDLQEDVEGVRRRDEIRQERREARERERRKEARGVEENLGPTLKRSKVSRDQDRDLAEKVALGQNVGRGNIYDQRLFNQGEGVTGGYGADDGYNIYDGALFETKRQYRPGGSGESELRGDSGNGGEGVGGTNASKGGKQNRGGIEFELDKEGKEGGEDIYGLDKFVSEAKRF